MARTQNGDVAFCEVSIENGSFGRNFALVRSLGQSVDPSQNHAARISIISLNFF